MASSLAICTCSMMSDLGLFELLAESIDRNVDSSVRHIVIVPKAHMSRFKVFENDRRSIMAQEDVLPFSTWKLPGATKILAPAIPAFRRPLYLTSGMKLVRGWLLQQVLKIEISRRISESAIMHVDSDVYFFRHFEASQAYVESKPVLFRVPEKDISDDGRRWSTMARRILDLPPSTAVPDIFVENCIVWSTDVVRDLVLHVEASTGHPFYEALLEHPAFSEYVLYGLFASSTESGSKISSRCMPFCLSLWDIEQVAHLTVEKVTQLVKPEHAAIAIQSTELITAEQRRKFYTEFEEHHSAYYRRSSR